MFGNMGGGFPGPANANAIRQPQLLYFGTMGGGFPGPANVNTVYHSNRSYEQGRQLSSGGFGTVYKVTRHQDDRVFAMKIAKRNSNTQANVRKEIDVLTKIRHQFIISLEDTAGTFLEPCLIMERARTSLACCGDLWRQDEDMARRMSCQVLHGLRHIHDRNIAHRDIKPDNVLVFNVNPPTFKLADCGCAENIAPARQFRPHRSGLSPVLIQRWGPGIAKNADRMDVYCLGLVVYWMLTQGRVPHVNRYHDPCETRRAAGQWRADTGLLRGLSRRARGFITALLKRDPGFRPAATAIEHPWLEDAVIT